MSDLPQPEMTRNALKQRLQKLDRPALCIFSARCGLRLLPFLVCNKGFNYWPGELKALHPMGLWRALLVAWVGSPNITDINIAKSALASINWENCFPGIHNHGGPDTMFAGHMSTWNQVDVIRAVVETIITSVTACADTTNYSSVLAADAALQSTATIAAIGSAITPKNNNQFDLPAQGLIDTAKDEKLTHGVIVDDLEILEGEGGFESIKGYALWGDKKIPAVKAATNPLDDFIHAIRSLYEGSEWMDEYIVESLGRFTLVYGKLFEGKVNDQSARDHLSFIESYFFPKMIEAARNNRDLDEYIQPYIDRQVDTDTDTDIVHVVHTDNLHDDNATKEDKLSRTSLANTLASLLSHKENRNKHQVIGLFGEWGVGKTSFLDILKESLKKEPTDNHFLMADFNAWRYEHTDNLQAGIAQEMVAALTTFDEPYEKYLKKDWRSLCSYKFNYNIQSLLCLILWLVIAVFMLFGSIVEILPFIPSRACLYFFTGVLLLSFLACCLRGWFFRNPQKSRQDSLWKRLNQSIYRLHKKSLIICQFALEIHGWKLAKLAFWLVLPFLAIFANKILIYFNDGLSNSVSGAISTLGIVSFIPLFLYFFKKLGDFLATPLAKELLTYLKLPSYGQHLGYLPVMRKHIEALVDIRLKKDGNKRILYVVDDLDRCQHASIVKVLEAVRLVLDMDRVTVIIAVDDRVALAALAKHYDEISNYYDNTTGEKNNTCHEIARDYLGKIIHLPIKLDKPDDKSLAVYLDSLWGRDQDSAEPESMPKPASGSVPKSEPETEPDSVPKLEPELVPKPESELEPKSESESEENSKVITIKGLTQDQKDAFKEGLVYFGLSNPRQVKRLINSYTLLLNLYSISDIDKKREVIKRRSQSDPEAVYPAMYTLLALEHRYSSSNPWSKSDYSLKPEMEKMVAPFILPMIKCDGQQKPLEAKGTTL